MADLHETASQTAGPYVHIGCMPNAAGIAGVYPDDLGAQMVRADTPGQHITVSGHIYDGTGAAVKDALVEVWQADADGNYPEDDTGFTGWGRTASDPDTGLWHFETIKPGPVTHGEGPAMAPHLTLWIAARGINIGLHTRMYFPEDVDSHATDPVLARIKQPLRSDTLIASPQGEAAYNFNIHLQGPEETVFFDV